MADSGLKVPERTEAEVRPLYEAMIKARAEYDACPFSCPAGTDPMQHEIHRTKLWRAMDDAATAFRKAIAP